jgi:hypothetical protein
VWWTRTYLAGWLIVALCGALTVSAPAAAKPKPRPQPKPSFLSGQFSGTVQEASPRPGTGKIRFLIARQSLSAVDIDVAEQCSEVIWIAVRDAPKTLRVPISGDGRFSYDKTILGDHLQLKGRLRGNHAIGTVFDSLTSGALSCSMPHASAFTAQH